MLYYENKALLWNFIKALQKLYKKVACLNVFKRTCWFLTFCILWKYDWINIF